MFDIPRKNTTTVSDWVVNEERSLNFNSYELYIVLRQ